MRGKRLLTFLFVKTKHSSSLRFLDSYVALDKRDAWRDQLSQENLPGTQEVSVSKAKALFWKNEVMPQESRSLKQNLLKKRVVFHLLQKACKKPCGDPPEAAPSASHHRRARQLRPAPQHIDVRIKPKTCQTDVSYLGHERRTKANASDISSSNLNTLQAFQGDFAKQTAS